MRHGKRIGVIIPALNEQDAIGRVLADIPAWADDIVVVDNGSTDATRQVAENAGARVVDERRRGYGSACLRGIDTLHDIDIVVFLDGDYSDHPDEMASLVDPIAAGRADLVIGSRVRGHSTKGALMPQQRFGNWLACQLIRIRYGKRFTDLGPFRAIDRRALDRLGLSEPTFGWTIEMQIKALTAHLDVHEVPVSYRPRIGQSKISGTVQGSLRAGFTILRVILQTAQDRTPRRTLS